MAISPEQGRRVARLQPVAVTPLSACGISTVADVNSTRLVLPWRPGVARGVVARAAARGTMRDTIPLHATLLKTSGWFCRTVPVPGGSFYNRAMGLRGMAAIEWF